MAWISKIIPYLAIVFAALLGGGSLIVLVLFLDVGSLGLLDLGLERVGVLAWDVLLCLAFFVQHSLMIRKSFRRRLVRFIPSHYQGAFYTVASGIVLLVLLVFWQQSAYTLIDLQGALSWLVGGIYFLAIADFAWSMGALGSFDAFGLNPILAQMRGTQEFPILPTHCTSELILSKLLGGN